MIGILAVGRHATGGRLAVPDQVGRPAFPSEASHLRAAGAAEDAGPEVLDAGVFLSD